MSKEAIKEGYLVKQGAIVKNWRKRWFALSDTKLFYYKRKEDTEPAGVIDITRSRLEDSVARPNSFSIVSANSGRAYLLVAETPQERDEWMNIIRVLVPSKIENPLQNLQPEQPPYSQPFIPRKSLSTQLSTQTNQKEDNEPSIVSTSIEGNNQNLTFEEFHRLRSPIVNSRRVAPLSKPIPESEFHNLLKELESATFKISREDVLREAAGSNFFTSEQLSKMIENLCFADERITVCRIIAPRIVDPENSEVVLQKLTFENEKRRVQRILENG